MSSGASPAIGRARPAIVGSGLIAARHVAALGELGIRPAAVYSPTREHAEAAATRWGCPAADDLASALDDFGCTHVHVCSPPMQHEEAVLAAAERHLQILCEKPLAPGAGMARRMEQAASGAAAGERKAAGAYLLFNRRLDKGVLRLRRAVVEGEIGRPVSVFGSYRQSFNAEPSSFDWRFDPGKVGPSRVVTEIGSHLFDLVSFVLDRPIEAVNAFVSDMGERRYQTGPSSGRLSPPNEDIFSAQLRLGDGVVGHIYGTELAHDAFDEIELRLDGTLRSGSWRSARPDQATISHKQEGSTTYGLPTPGSSLLACLRAIYLGDEGLSYVASFRDGVSVALAMDAVRESAASGEWQELAGL